MEEKQWKIFFAFSLKTGKNLFALKASALSNNLIAITKEGQVGLYDPSLHVVGEFYTPSKKMYSFPFFLSPPPPPPRF